MNTNEETALDARRELERVFAGSGLSGPQFGILCQLDADGSMPLSELGNRLWVSWANVTGLVDKLAAAGYVRRIRLRRDRRVVLAELTEKGRDAISELRPLHRDCLMRFTAGLDVTEMRRLQSILEKLTRPCKEEPRRAGKPGGN